MPQSHAQPTAMRHLVASLLILALGFTQAWATPQPTVQEDLPHTVSQVVTGILSYSRWPTDNDHKQLCVLGATEFSSHLLSNTDTLPGWTPGVISIDLTEAALDQCHALYSGQLSDDSQQTLRQLVQGRALLTINENDPLCAIGSMFCLQISHSKVAFKINLDAVQRSGIQVHPAVLKLGMSTGARHD